MRLRIGALIQTVLILLMVCVPGAAAADTAGITATLDKSTASVGETVTVSGTTQAGAWVPLKVVDQAGSILVFDATKADSSGTYSIQFKVPTTAAGTLTVVLGEGANVATATLTVVSAPVPVTGVSITQGDQELEVGESVQLTAVVEPANATNKAVTWSSSNAAVATVSETGLVTAVSPGTATITVTTEDGNFSDSITVTVVEARPYIVSITEVHNVQVPYGTSEAEAIAALASQTTILDSKGATHTVTLNWSIADYDGNTPGDYTATATFELPAGVEQSDPPMDLKVTATVTVLPQPKYAVTLAVQPVGGGTVTGAGEYPEGATVTVEAQAAAGYTFVNWTDAQGKEVSAAASYTFTMGTQPVSLTANFRLLEASQYAFRYELPAEIVEGQDVEVAVTFESVEVKDLGYDGVRFKFSAAGPGDVTFTAEDSNGVVHTFTNQGYWGPASGFDLPKEYSATTHWTLNFAQAGTYTVTFSLIDADSEAVIAGLTESITVTVVPATIAVTGVSITQGDQELEVGETVQLTAVVEPANATNKAVTWSSGNAAVATVSETGLVTAVSAGTATITVRTQDGGYTDSITVTVVSAHVPVTGVSIAEGDLVKLRAGKTVQLTAVVQPENATNKAVTWSVSWSSGKEAAVTVDQNGLVTAVWPGRATITVTTQDGNFTDSIDIVVTGPPVKAWPPGGAVVRGTRVTLSSTTEGADIYYTLDGSDPTPAASRKYDVTNPITVDGPVTIKAIAVMPGMEDDIHREVLTVSYTIAAEIADTEVAVDESKKDLAVTEKTKNVKISVPDKVKDATISVSALLKEPDPGSEVVSTEPLPELNVEVTDTSISSAAPIKVSIPPGTTVTAPEGWNGTINVPRVESAQSVKVEADPGKKAKVHTVIEVGYGDVPLTFDKAVRLLIPGQAGKEAGYYRGGKFTKIPSLPAGAQDAQDWADGYLLGDRTDGKMDVGSDLVIWTRHFTKFVTYTQTSISTGGGGDSGDGVPSPTPVTSTTGTARVTPAAGGTVGLGDEAAIVIPANALTGTSLVEVKIEKVSAPPAPPAGYRLVGSVYEFTVDGKPSYSFAKKVTIRLSFDPGALGEGETPSIHRYDQEQGRWINLGGRVAGNTVSVEVEHLSKYAVMVAVRAPQPQPSFSDTAGHWAEDSIKELVGLGVIGGYPDGTFRPDNKITRAEFAALLVRAFKLEGRGGKVFADTAGHWAQDAIATAAHHGLVAGYNADTFGPDDPITREQLAAMMVRAAKLSPVSAEMSFKDGASISGWAREAVATAVKNGIIGGYPDNTLRPQGHATRAEAATVVLKALQK